MKYEKREISKDEYEKDIEWYVKKMRQKQEERQQYTHHLEDGEVVPDENLEDFYRRIGAAYPEGGYRDPTIPLSPPQSIPPQSAHVRGWG